MFSSLLCGLLVAAASARAATLYLAGDSTMAANAGNDAIIGWGVFAGNYLNIPVVNRAVAGRSSRSYTDEGRCKSAYIMQIFLLTGDPIDSPVASLISIVQAGDIAVIEFGHNDGGGPSASTRGVCSGEDTTTTCNV